jgi:hypothetical protein
VYGYDFVSNIVYDWRLYNDSGAAGYGMLFRDSAIDDVNVTGNAFIDGGWRPTWGCVFGSKPGPDKGAGGESPSEQALRTRAIYFDEATNLGGDDCRGKFLRTLPNSRPYILPNATLQEVLATVGAQPRFADEQALIDEIAAQLP